MGKNTETKLNEIIGKRNCILRLQRNTCRATYWSHDCAVYPVNLYHKSTEWKNEVNWSSIGAGDG